MAYDHGAGKQLLQFAQQGEQGSALLQGAGVFRGSRGVESAFIADADAVAVVMKAMGSHVFQVPSLVDGSVAGDVEMIAYVAESTVVDVVVAAGFHRKALAFRCGTAVHNEQGNGSHGQLLQLWIPNTPATAVATVMMILRMNPQVPRLLLLLL